MRELDGETRAALQHWYQTLERCVGAVDYATARAIVHPQVASFGTHAELVQGLDELQARQWSNVWPNITDFAFDLAGMVGGRSGDVAWAAATWSSTGYHEDGAPFDRPGRATVTFVHVNGRWLATHTHFSLNPGTPPRTYGPRGGPRA